MERFVCNHCASGCQDRLRKSEWIEHVSCSSGLDIYVCTWMVHVQHLDNLYKYNWKLQARNSSITATTVQQTIKKLHVIIPAMTLFSAKPAVLLMCMVGWLVG